MSGLPLVTAVLGTRPVLPRLTLANIIELLGLARLFTATLFRVISIRLLLRMLLRILLACMIGAMTIELGFYPSYVVFASKAPAMDVGLRKTLLRHDMSILLALVLAM